MREATLQGAVLALDGIESVLSDQPEAAAVRAVLRRALMQRRGPTLMLGEARWEPAVWLAGLPTLMVELTLPSQPPHISRRHPHQVMTAEHDRARDHPSVGRQHPDDRGRGGRLAAPGFTNYGEDLAGSHFERHVSDGLQQVVAR